MSVGETRDPEKVRLEAKLKKDVAEFLAKQEAQKLAMGETKGLKTQRQIAAEDRSRRRAAAGNKARGKQGRRRAKPTGY